MRQRPILRIALYVLFATLIVTGIAMKRIFDHAEWLPPFHITALLVLVGISLMSEKRGRRGVGSEAADGSASEDALPPPRWDDV